MYPHDGSSRGLSGLIRQLPREDFDGLWINIPMDMFVKYKACMIVSGLLHDLSSGCYSRSNVLATALGSYLISWEPLIRELQQSITISSRCDNERM